MRSIFYVLSDDYIGSTPKFAPGSQALPSEAAPATNDNEVIVDMEVAAPTSGLSQALKRKSGDLFSGTSKVRAVGQSSGSMSQLSQLS
jgi:hypothetical protein